VLTLDIKDGVSGNDDGGKGTDTCYYDVGDIVLHCPSKRTSRRIAFIDNLLCLKQPDATVGVEAWSTVR
jgi:hypothetical protein